MPNLFILFVSFLFGFSFKYFVGENELQRDSSLGSLEQSISEIITLKPKKKEVELSDHIQFSITEKWPPQSSRTDIVRDQPDDGDILSEGRL